MFRIDKQLVQVSQPANIPLIPVSLPANEPPKVEAEAGTVAAEVAAANLLAAEKSRASAKAEAAAESRRDKLLQEAQHKAEQLLDEARQAAEQQAEDILREAGQKAEAVRVQAWQEGFDEGKNDALLIQVEQTRAAQQQINELLAEIKSGLDTLYSSFEGEMLDLALAIAGKIAHTVVQRDDQAIQAIITHALKHMRREGKITIRVSDEQYNTFFNAESATFALGDESISATIVNDPLLGGGDLLLEADGETVNAGVDSQLKYLALAFGRPREPGL